MNQNRHGLVRENVEGKFLILAATEMELPEFLKNQDQNENSTFVGGICGVGLVNTTFNLTRILAQNKGILGVINIGIAGSFDSSLKIGEIVNVESDFFGDIGAETSDGPLDLFEMDLEKEDDFPYLGGVLYADLEEFDFLPLSALPFAKGMTVAQASGTIQTIDSLVGKYDPKIESMEGAAVFYTCKQMGIPVVQIRSISNMVTARNKEEWDVPLALENLHIFLEEALKSDF
ncbi:MAG: futalosine hydrolase [Sphingobacteriales bacterium]|jgi:futalosine hydrolase